MILLAIGAQLIAPEPKSMWISGSDNPRPREELVVSIRATVDPEGKIRDCAIEQSSKTPSVDALTCQLAMKRARFRAARWTDGSVAYGIYRTHVRWLSRNPSQEAIQKSNLVLPLLAGMKLGTEADIVLAVDEQGRINSCEASRSRQKVQLIKLACDHAVLRYSPVKVRSQDGALVKSVQMVTVGFVKQ